MGNVLEKWFVKFALIVFISCKLSASDEWSEAFQATLCGKIVKKYFQAPKIIQDPPFGWFVELNENSRLTITELYNNLAKEEKDLFNNIQFQHVRLYVDKFTIREWARKHCGEEVTLEGELVSPDLFSEFYSFNFIPEEVTPAITKQEEEAANIALNMDPTESNTSDWNAENLLDESLVLADDEAEKLVVMTGKLTLRVFNSDPDRGSIENGGHPLYHWMLTLDPTSFAIACSTPVRASFQTPATIRSFKNCNDMELTGEFDEEWLTSNANQIVTVPGYLWHAHTGHHRTAVMLSPTPWLK